MNLAHPGFWMFFSSAVSLGVAVFIQSRKTDKAMNILSWLLIISSLWGFGFGAQYLTENQAYLRPFNLISYIGITLSPQLWLLFAAAYTQNDRWVNRKTIVILFSIPVISLVALATNRFHHLFYASESFSQNGMMIIYQVKYGPLWIFHSAWSFGAGVAGIVLFLRMILQAEPQDRLKISYFVIGSLIPYITNIFYLSGVRPYNYVDLTPVAFSVMGLLLLVGSYHIRLIDIKPLALDVLFNHFPDPILVFNTNGRITNANTAARQLIEVLRFGAKGRESNAESDEALTLFLHDEQLTDFNIGQRSFYRSQNPIFLRNGKEAGKLMVLHDITKEKEKEQSLKNSEMRFMSLLNSSTLLVNAFAPGPTIMLWNKTSEIVTGYSAKEMIGNTRGLELLYPDENYRKSVFDQVARHPHELNTFEITTKSGEKRFITWFNVFNNTGTEDWSSWAIGLDVTEQKLVENSLRENEKKLQELNASKDLFFSIIAHDLRSPFNSLIGLSELMVELVNEQDYESIAKYARVFHETSKNTYSLLENLLDWSRTQTGAIPYSPEYIELHTFIDEEIQLSAAIAQEKNIQIVNELTGKSLVFADRTMLASILRNLLSNAIKFSYREGKIVIRAEKQANMMRVSVQDYGVGISTINQEKLFRLESSFTTKGTANERGTGLGLILCKAFVEKHEGQIWVKSQEGKGSTFHFTIPLFSLQV